MMMSYSKRFVFIHIDKTAGTSVKDALYKYCWYPHESIWNTFLKRMGIRYYSEEFYDHIRAYELQRYLSPLVYQRMFKFAFTRNPWDWMLSSYTYFLKNRNMHPHTYYQENINSFRDFILWQVNTPMVYHTQSEYITDKHGKLIVDFAGKFERLNEDFQHICRQIGIEEKLPHLNLSKQSGYQHEYDAACKDLVYKHYRQDIEMFGYEF
jgi:hypothetical protein